MADIDLSFEGGIVNRTWDEITMNEFVNALNKCGWREAHNAHIYQRLRERGPFLGVFTPGDFARALRDGYSLPARDGATARVCWQGRFTVIYKAAERALITLVPA